MAWQNMEKRKPHKEDRAGASTLPGAQGHRDHLAAGNRDSLSMQKLHLVPQKVVELVVMAVAVVVPVACVRILIAHKHHRHTLGIPNNSSFMHVLSDHNQTTLGTSPQTAPNYLTKPSCRPALDWVTKLRDSIQDRTARDRIRTSCRPEIEIPALQLF